MIVDNIIVLISRDIIRVRQVYHDHLCAIGKCSQWLSLAASTFSSILSCFSKDRSRRSVNRPSWLGDEGPIGDRGVSETKIEAFTKWKNPMIWSNVLATPTVLNDGSENKVWSIFLQTHSYPRAFLRLLPRISFFVSRQDFSHHRISESRSCLRRVRVSYPTISMIWRQDCIRRSDPTFHNPVLTR